MGNADTRVNGYRRALEICWLAAIFLIPLFFNPLSHQAFYLNKVLLLQFLVFVMLALAVADGMSHPSGPSGLKWPDVATSPLHLSVLTFGLLATVATVTSLTPAISFWGSWGRGEGLLTLLCWVLFFLIVARHLRNRAQLYRAMYMLLLSSAIVSGWGILQNYFPDILPRLFHDIPGGRVFSTTGQPLSLSLFLAMVIPLNLAFIVRAWHSRREGSNTGILAALSTLLVLQFWCLWLAQYSVTILLFIIAPIAFIILLGIIRRKRLWFSFGIVCLLALGTMAAWLVVPMLLPGTGIESPETEDSGSIITAEDLGLFSIRERVQYWRGSIDIVFKSPEVPFSEDSLRSLRTFIGYGPETFIVTFQHFFPEERRSFHTNLSLLVDRPHQHYLYLATTVGLLGLASFLAILAVFFYLLFHHLRRATLHTDKLLIIGLMAGMTQYMVDGLFNPATPSPELVFWLMLALVPALGRLSSSHEPARAEVTLEGGIAKATRTRTYLAMVLAVLLIVAGTGLTIRPFLADMQLQKGLDLQARHDAGAIFAFSEAVKLKPGEAAYWSSQGAYRYSIARRASQESARTTMLTMSAADYERARELEPYIAYRYYSLADVYLYWAQQGAKDKWPAALSLYDSASQLFPGNAVIVNKQALALIIKEDFSEARTRLDYAASLDPDWAETSFLSGLLLAREGKINEAAAEIIAPIQASPDIHKRFINLHYFIDLGAKLTLYGMVPPLGDALELYTEKIPGEWVPQAMLGITRFFEGSPDKSLGQFDTAMSLVPDEEAGNLFRITLRLAEISPNFKARLAGVAPDWRAKLSRSTGSDTLLPVLDELIDTDTGG